MWNLSAKLGEQHVGNLMAGWLQEVHHVGRSVVRPCVFPEAAEAGKGRAEGRILAVCEVR